MATLIESVRSAVSPLRSTVESTRSRIGLGFVDSFKQATGITFRPLDRMTAMRAGTAAGGPFTGGPFSKIMETARTRFATAQEPVGGGGLGLGVLGRLQPRFTERSRTGAQVTRTQPGVPGFKEIGFRR